MLKVIPATAWHLCDFMKHARSLDLAEVKYATGLSFEEHSLRDLAGTLALVDKTDRVYAIGGYDKNHVVWMLCTTRVEENKIKFLRFIKKYYQDVIDKEGWLYNYVWLGNELHVKWLEYMGAEFFSGETHVWNGQLFILFNFIKKEGE